MKAQTKWNSGNFTLAHETGELSEPQVQALVNLGLTNLVQRTPGHDEVLGIVKKGADGKAVRVKGLTRAEVAYAPSLAESLAKLDGFKSRALGEGIPAVAFDTVVTEYTRESDDMKYKAATAAASRHESAGDLEEWLTRKSYTDGTFTVDAEGYDGPTHTEDGENFAKPMLAYVHGILSALARKHCEKLATV